MKTILKICAMLAALAAAVTLSSCSIWLRSLEYDKTTNIYTDKSSGVTYTDAPFVYEARAIGDKYAKQTGDGGKTVFHKIKDMEPALWLTEKWGTVFYATSMALPTLSELEPVSVLICVEEIKTFVLAEITDQESISSLIASWEEGEALEYPVSSPQVNLRVKFESEKYPGLLYSLIYLEYSDGGKYLCRRDDGRCVAVGDLISAALEGKDG